MALKEKRKELATNFEKYSRYLKTLGRNYEYDQSSILKIMDREDEMMKGNKYYVPFSELKSFDDWNNIGRGITKNSSGISIRKRGENKNTLVWDISQTNKWKSLKNEKEKAHTVWKFNRTLQGEELINLVENKKINSSTLEEAITDGFYDVDDIGKAEEIVRTMKINSGDFTNYSSEDLIEESLEVISFLKSSTKRSIGTRLANYSKENFKDYTAETFIPKEIGVGINQEIIFQDTDEFKERYKKIFSKADEETQEKILEFIGEKTNNVLSKIENKIKETELENQKSGIKVYRENEVNDIQIQNALSNISNEINAPVISLRENISRTNAGVWKNYESVSKELEERNEKAKNGQAEKEEVKFLIKFKDKDNQIKAYYGRYLIGEEDKSISDHIKKKIYHLEISDLKEIEL